MFRRIPFVFTLALTFVTACSSESEPAMHAPVGAPSMEAAPPSTLAPATSTPTSPTYAASPSTDAARPRDVVRTASVRLRDPHPARVVDSARQWIESHEGFVADSSTIGAGGAPGSSRATFRVPTSGYGEALRRLRALATVLEVTEHGEDVTLARADADARIASKRALEQRLVALTEHVGSVAELIQVEKELGRVRAEIESMEATQRALVDRISYATLTLSVEAPNQPVVASAESFGSRLERSFASGVHAAGGVVLGAVAFVTATSPLIVLALVIGGIFRWNGRRARRATSASS